MDRLALVLKEMHYVEDKENLQVKQMWSALETDRRDINEVSSDFVVQLVMLGTGNY